MVKKGPKHEDQIAEETKKLVPEKPTTAKEITTFLSAHVNDPAVFPDFANLLRRSPCTVSLVKTVVSFVFQLSRDQTADLDWCEKLVQCVNAEVMWPHKPLHEALFFPSDDNEYRILHYLQTAKRSIVLCIYALTNDTLVQELVTAHQRGVSIRVISDDEMTKLSGADLSRLVDMGIQGRIDLSPKSNMHHKFCIVDESILMTGSFNWTKQAVEKNQENLIVVDDSVLIQAYLAEFERLWTAFAPVKEAKPALNLSVQKFVDTLVAIFRKPPSSE